MSKKRIFLIDFLKAICVIFVIITHSDFLNDAMLDKTGLFYLLAVNKAVPVFMFLTGYVYVLSNSNKSADEQFDRLFYRFMRFTIPALVAYLLFVAIWAISEGGLNLSLVIERFFISDYGRGSYYYPLMVQFLFLAPLMFGLIKKYGKKGVLYIGLANLIYELFCTFVGINISLYRILVFRYLLIIAFGMYMAHTRRKKHKIWVFIAMLFVGLVYILLPYFTSYEYKLFTISPWNKSGMMSAFYVAAVMFLLFKLFGKFEGRDFISSFISKIGQASYHIMYTQMIYFVVRPAFDELLFDITTLPIASQYVVDIVVCVLSGLVFCAVDNKFFGKFYRR